MPNPSQIKIATKIYKMKQLSIVSSQLLRVTKDFFECREIMLDGSIEIAVYYTKEKYKELFG